MLRIGHTSTGAAERSRAGQRLRLECDKLSKEGIEANFNGMMARLIADVGPRGGQGAGRHARR